MKMVTHGSLDQHPHMINNKKGQSTVEFLSCITIAFAFIFFFMKQALNYTNGYLVQYATFMASRAYLVTDNNNANAPQVFSYAEGIGKQVFESYYITKFMPNFDGEIRFNSPADNVIKAFVGAYATYTDRLSFTKTVGGKIPMEFRSESFLGKEPTRTECAKRTCDAISASVGSCSDHTTLFDNGC